MVPHWILIATFVLCFALFVVLIAIFAADDRRARRASVLRSERAGDITAFYRQRSGTVQASPVDPPIATEKAA